MPLLLIVLSLIAALILVCLIQLVIDVRAIRSQLLPGIRHAIDAVAASQRPSAAGAFQMASGWGHSHFTAPIGVGLFVVWEWNDGKWRLPPGMIPAGIDPGAPPGHRGSFQGEYVKSWVAGKR